MTTRSYQGKTSLLGERIFIDPSAVLVGDIEIGADSSIWPLVVIRGDIHRIHTGQCSSIQDGSVLHITHANLFNPSGFPSSTGDEMTVGYKVLLRGCSIDNRVLMRMGSIIMDGMVIGDEVILGADSLVPPGKVLESGFLYIGSPAKKACPLGDRERGFSAYTAGNYAKLKDLHITEGYHA